MNKPTITLVLLASVVYYAILFLSASFQPRGSTTPLYLIALPLVIMVLIIVSDLSYRATTPTQPRRAAVKPGKTVLEVQEIRKKIEVAAKASPEYFDTVLRSQLRQILVEKVSLELGMEPKTVREILESRKRGLELLRNDVLYDSLYGPTSRVGNRIKEVEESVKLLEEWKP